MAEDKFWRGLRRLSMNRFTQALGSWFFFWRSTALGESQARFRNAIRQYESSVMEIKKKAGELRNGGLEQSRKNNADMRKIQSSIKEAVHGEE